MVSVYFFKPLLDRLAGNQAERERQTCSRGLQVGLKPRPTTLRPYSICSPNELNQPLYKFKMLVCAGKSKKSKVILKVITF